MLKSGIVRDVILFIVILLFLMAVIPVISSLFKQLITLQVIILVVSTAALTYLVHKVRGKSNNK